MPVLDGSLQVSYLTQARVIPLCPHHTGVTLVCPSSLHENFGMITSITCPDVHRAGVTLCVSLLLLWSTADPSHNHSFKSPVVSPLALIQTAQMAHFVSLIPFRKCCGASSLGGSCEICTFRYPDPHRTDFPLYVAHPLYEGLWVDPIHNHPFKITCALRPLLCVVQMAHFVSLIPFMEDSGLYKRRGDVWCTNSEFMYLTAGDSEEHAHLLAGYFLEIGQQVRFALKGVPLSEG